MRSWFRKKKSNKIETAKSEQNLDQMLRQRIAGRCEQNRKNLLKYYSPVTALLIATAVVPTVSMTGCSLDLSELIEKAKEDENDGSSEEEAVELSFESNVSVNLGETGDKTYYKFTAVQSQAYLVFTNLSFYSSEIKYYCYKQGTEQGEQLDVMSSSSENTDYYYTDTASTYFVVFEALLGPGSFDFMLSKYPYDSSTAWTDDGAWDDGWSDYSDTAAWNNYSDYADDWIDTWGAWSDWY